MVPPKHKYPILNLADELEHISALDVVKHLKNISGDVARATLNFYVKMGWLERIKALLESDNPKKRIHYISGYKLTNDGRFELERMRRRFG